MASLQDWISASRIRTLPLAVANVAMGGVLAYHFGRFDALLFIYVLITAVALQILSNYANDYGDGVSGVDSVHRDGPKRAVQSGRISTASMKRAMYVAGFIALLSGVCLIYWSPLSLLIQGFFLVTGLLSIWAAVRYTAGDNPYGYRALGDLSVFVFFGIVAVLGTYMVMGSAFDWRVCLPAISCGLFSMAVLNINNIRDIESDQKAGKISLAIVLGRSGAIVYHRLLLCFGLLSTAVFTVLTYSDWSQWMFLLVTPLLYNNITKLTSARAAVEVDPLLKQMALTTLLFVALFGLGLSIS